MPKSDEQAALTYDPELAPGYFVQARSDFLRHPGFSCYAKLLYLVLCSYAGEGASAWPGQVKLAEHLGVTDRTIRNVMPELVAAELVSVRQQGLNRPNIYHIHKLPTLPAVDRNVVPVRERNHVPVRERNHVPIKNGTRVRSKQEPSSDEVESVKIESDQIDSNMAAPLLENVDGTSEQPDSGQPTTKRYSAWIAQVVIDHLGELGFLNGATSVDKVLLFWSESGLTEAAFVDVLNKARNAVRKAEGSRGGVSDKRARWFDEIEKLSGGHDGQ